MIRKSIPKKFRFSLVIFLLASSVLMLLFATFPLVHASSAIVQESAGGCAITGCGYIPPITVSLPNPVTAGNVILVAIGADGGIISSVSDTLGSTFTQAVSDSVYLGGVSMYSYIYYATLSSSGSDSVSVMLSSLDQQAGVYIYEITGVTVTGLITETGTGTCSSSPCSISTSSSATFASGTLLLGMVGTIVYSNPTPGSGFALYSGSNPSLAAFGGYAESSASGVTSPTNFPFTFSSSSMNWAEVGIALSSASGSSSTTTSTATSTSTTTSSTTTIGFSTDQAASHVVGQPDFVSNVCAFGSPTASNVCDPYGVAFDSSGNLWVADEGHSRVVEYPSSSLTSNGPSASLALGSPSLTGGSCPSSSYPTTTSPGNCLSDIREIAFNSSGTLFVADHGEEGIVAFSPPFSTGMNGNLVLGGQGCTSNQSSICQPDGMAFDSHGNLWVTDGSLARVLEFVPPFSPGELASVVIGQPDYTSRSCLSSAASLCGPKGVAFDGSGNLWVSDYGSDRVLEFKAPFSNGMSASLVIGTGTCTAPTTSSFCGPRGIAFDSSGNLWVADTGYNRVLEFAPPFTGGASIVLGQIDFTSELFPPASQSTFSGPEDLAFDASGNLWVSDNSNSRVLEFALTTSTTTTSATTTSTTSTTTSTSSSTSTSTSYTSSTTSSTSTSTVPTRAHVSITLNPFLPSNAISANNYFLVTYTDEGTTNFALEQGGTLQIIADIGSTISIAATSSGSNAAEQWCLSATSGGTCQPTTILVGASGVSVTYVYYDIQLQFVGYEISGGGTPIAPYFGVYATAPLVVTSSPSARDATITSLPLSATSYASIWLLAGTVAVFEPIINTNPTAASQQWQGVPACDILFVGAISCGNYVSDYQIGPFSQGGVFITIDYHHQYSQQVSFSVIGSGTGYSAPTLNYVSAGSSQLLTLTQSAFSLFLDAGSSWSVTPNPLAGSTATNNWIAASGTTGTITGPGTIDPVYAKSVPGQIPANLQESFGVSDTLVPSPQAPLSDGVSISDKYVPPSSAALVDVITLEDTYIAPLTAPLFDSVAVNDYFVSPIVNALNDLVGVGEKLTSSPFLAAGGTYSGTIMFTVHSPVNILVTDTLGKQAGFNSTGSMINTIPGAQIIPKNGTQLETIIIPDPLSGQYTIEVFPVNGGGNYTIESQSTNVNGTVVTDTHQTGSITSGTQYLGVTLSSAGQITETPPSSTPPSQSNSSYMIIIIIAIAAVAVAALGSSLFIWRRRRR